MRRSTVRTASSGRGSDRTTRTAMYTPVSRNNFLKVASGKSDHATLSKANVIKKASAEFCATNLRHWNERETRITNDARVRIKKIVRSTGLPSPKAGVALEA